MSTIKDVARRTGLSLSTISKYLNSGNVREENRLAIDAAIEELDYSVNVFARSLKANRSMTIGVLLPTISSPFFGRVVAAMEPVLRRSGYECFVCSYDFDREQELKKLEFLARYHVDGIVYVPENVTAGEVRARVGAIPVVLIDRSLDQADYDTVVVDKLFAIMRNMKADGKSLIIITHKLHEVLDVSDRVAVLRKGEYVGDVATKDADQQSLTDMMVGHTVSLNISRPEPKDVEKRLVIEGLTAYDELGVKRLDDVSFTINAGEVLGIAGVAGSGQRELLESIAGLYPVASGHVTFYPPDGGKEKELVGLDPMKIRKSGISMSFVPEDRLGMGLVGSMGMTGNMMLRSWRKGKGLFLNRKDPEALANRIWEELGVVTPSTSFPVRRMSGGNVQKVLVGREIAQSPAVLMTAYAVRGLDINTSYTIYNLLTEQKMKGVAVVYVGEDLDVLLELCDRIVVLCGGQVSGVVDARTADKRQIGALMTRMEGGKTDE